MNAHSSSIYNTQKVETVSNNRRDKQGYIHNHSIMKWNKIMIYKTRWVNSYKKEYIYLMVSFICTIEQEKINMVEECQNSSCLWEL